MFTSNKNYIICKSQNFIGGTNEKGRVKNERRIKIFNN